MSSHYNFAEIATRIIAVAFDTTGKAWIVQREFINSAWRTTLESHFTPVNQVEFTATIPAGHAGFGTVQMSGWPFPYEDPVLITLGGEAGLGAARELPPHPLVGINPIPTRLQSVSVKFDHQPPATPGMNPQRCQVTFDQKSFSQASFDLVKLLSPKVPTMAVWFALRLSGANKGGIVFANGAVFDGNTIDANNNKTPFKGIGRFEYL